MRWATANGSSEGHRVAPLPRGTVADLSHWSTVAAVRRMSMSSFHKATRESLYARLFIMGAAGDGKSYTAQRVAAGLADGGPIFVLDTHGGQAEMYAGQPDGDGGALDFMAAQIVAPYTIQKCTDLIGEAIKAGAAVLIVDSLSDFWEGKGGILEAKAAKERGNSRGNGYTLWMEFGRKWMDFMRLLNNVQAHVIVTSRRKTDYELVKNEHTGKSTPTAIGTKPLVREGTEYEFDFILSMIQAEAMIAKTRSESIAPSGTVIDKPGARFGQSLLKWLRSGDAAEGEIRSGLVMQAGAAMVEAAESAGVDAQVIAAWLSDAYGEVATLPIPRLRGLPAWLRSPAAHHAYKVWAQKRETVSAKPGPSRPPQRQVEQDAPGDIRDELIAFIKAGEIAAAVETYWAARSPDSAKRVSIDAIAKWKQDAAQTFGDMLHSVLAAGRDGIRPDMTKALGRDVTDDELRALGDRVRWAAESELTAREHAVACALLARRCVEKPETLHLRLGLPKVEQGEGGEA